MLTSVEFCSGGGGQALGLEQAGFGHEALVEIDEKAVLTLRHNRPSWVVHAADISSFNPSPCHGVDLVAAGLPCPPFSKAGKQLGAEDERNLFPAALELISQIKPAAVLIENVRGILDEVFSDFREDVTSELEKMGFAVRWTLVQASEHGVSQLRPRVLVTALRPRFAEGFHLPVGLANAPAVGDVLFDLMAARGWEGAEDWAQGAQDIAPTIVGGSKKHGGPDLGPTRARQAWLKLGVDGRGLADHAPDPGFEGIPRLTNRMVARLQGFPDDWEFMGGKTAAYRQIGNALPPPLARAFGKSLAAALHTSHQRVFAF